MHLVADQPQVVREAVGGFTEALFEAVAIVLVISFISLGLRAGLVVSLTIPLVLAITFLAMQFLGISLQRISLGALIIALGLLVDDAMIAIEMMVSRLEAGDSRDNAATAIYTSTAFPMLTGTLVTVAGFIPVGLNSSAAGEFTFSLFVVIAVSLIVSWIVAVLFAPLLGVTLLPKAMKSTHERKGVVFQGVRDAAARLHALALGDDRVTLALFAVSVVGLGHVQQQFFPTSDRTEVIVDWTGRENASIEDTREGMDRLEKLALAGDPDVERWTSYVGQGAVRFMLSFDVQPPSPFFGQMIIIPKDLAARDRVRKKIETIVAQQFRRRRRLRASARHRPAGRTPRAVPRHGPGHSGRAPTGGKVLRPAFERPERRAHRARLERAGPRRQSRHRSGQGGGARRHLVERRPGPQRRRRRRHHHPSARFHLRHRRDRPRQQRRPLVDRRAAKPADSRPRAAFRCRSPPSRPSTTNSSSRRSGAISGCRRSRSRPRS